MSRPALRLVALAALLSASAIAAERMASFPGEVSELPSPDGSMVLRNVDSDQEPHHVLYLKDVGRKTEEKLLAYGRHASALWSHDGHGLIVNDYGGSDFSNSLIFLVGANRKQVDVREELRKQSAGNQTIFGNHHVYIEGIEWTAPGKVKVKISGYGDVDPKGFTLLYEYAVGGQFRLLKKTASFEPRK